MNKKFVIDFLPSYSYVIKNAKNAPVFVGCISGPGLTLTLSNSKGEEINELTGLSCMECTSPDDFARYLSIVIEREWDALAPYFDVEGDPLPPLS